MAGVEEKRWSNGDWNYHGRPGVEHEADLTISYRDTVMMEVSGSREFCRTMVRAMNYDKPEPGHYRCRVIQMSPDFT